MAIEYKLSYTGSEINEKLGKVDKLVSTVNGIAPDASGNVKIETQSGGGQAIIDVVELPTENINTNAFYRLVSAKFVSSFYSAIDNWTCYYVNGLPSVGEPVSADMVNITAYYNAQDNEVYGYADSNISAVGGIPVGWYPIGVLGQAFGVAWGGIITDADEIDDSAKVLLKYDFYVYKDGWSKLVFGYEKAPKFDITWDGDMSGHVALDMSALGYANIYFVKVNDKVPTTDEVVGWDVKVNSYNEAPYEFIVETEHIDTNTYPGAYSIRDYIVVVHDADTLASALGIPSGIYPNGIYFWLNTEDGYVSRFSSPSRITKIDKKFIDVPEIDMSEYPTTTYVQSMINNAIGNAIGGSY